MPRTAQPTRDELAPIHDAALPKDAPGAWIRAAIERMTACSHERVRQIDEHDVECLDCGTVSA